LQHVKEDIEMVASAFGYRQSHRTCHCQEAPKEGPERRNRVGVFSCYMV
jgi:hypothetical protein